MVPEGCKKYYSRVSGIVFQHILPRPPRLARMAGRWDVMKRKKES